MANDADWVADVKRWVLAGRQAAPVAEDSGFGVLGYEAAHPALQSAHWPDAPRISPPSASQFGNLT
jgi:hypothetical protein